MLNLLKTRKIFLFLIFILFFNSSLGQQIKFEEYDLPNGLHVILHKDNSNPVVAISVAYHVGSKNEKPNRTGFAHFFEHLLFEGSENIKRGEFSQYISNAGGIDNAYTQQDKTYYHEILLSNQVGLGLWLESERMLHAKVDNEGIKTQREVVKEEKRLRIDNQPYSDAITRVLWNNLFPTHPYNWAVIGSMEDLNSAYEEDYKDFYKTYYVPNNAVLTVAGDIRVSHVKNLINRYFSTIPKGKNKINRPNIIEKPIDKEITKEYIDKNAEIPAIIYGYRTPKQIDKDSYILSVIANILSNGESSRIIKNVQNKKQLSVGIESFLWPLEDYGVFLIFGMINQGIEIDDLGNAIDEEIENLKKYGITKKEFETQINKMEKKFIEANLSMQGIAENLSENYLFYNNTNLINTQIEIYRSIKIEDIKRIANKYLNKNQRVKLIVNPGNKKN